MATQDGLLSDLACSLNCLALKMSLNIVPGTWYRYAYILMCVLYEMRTTYVARNMAAFIQETRLSVPGNSMSSKYQVDCLQTTGIRAVTFRHDPNLNRYLHTCTLCGNFQSRHFEIHIYTGMNTQKYTGN